MKRMSAHLLLALGLALLAGCPASSETGSAQLAVSVPQALSSSISRVSVTASAADFPSFSVDLVSSNGVWGGVLGSIPAGANRTFLAQAFDASGTLLFQGSASGVSIATGQTAFVALTLQQVNAPPPFQNAAPLLDSLVASSTSVSTGGALSLTASAHDSNPGDPLSYAWTSTAGAFSSASATTTTWTAPAFAGLQTLTLTVTDPGGLTARASLSVNVLTSGGQGNAQLFISFNTSPLVASLTASASQLALGQTTSVSASASDSDGDTLSYAWSASCAGSWSNASSSSAAFTPDALPAGPCNNCDLTVSVSDGRGGQNTGTVALCVSNPPAPSHSNPVIVRTYRSSETASAGQVLTFEVVGSDPEGSALSFSWAANTGTLGTPSTGASSSRITWTAPACARASTPPHLTATVTNAFNLTATKSFEVTGLPVCVPGWALTGAMASSRYEHTATLLNNGKVLVSGGRYTATAEVYDPASGTWSATGSLAGNRYGHTATLLNNGKVLVSGGHSNNSGTLASAEVYDPASSTWSTTGSLASPRRGHTATLLNNGKVLVAGGDTRSAEVYDPASGTWSATGLMASSPWFPTATLLPNGKVLISGGDTRSAEVYDPASGTWSTTGSMASYRRNHTATLLPNGKVLVSGGYNSVAVGSVEVYDPASGTWSTTGSLASPRWAHTATLLPDGKVLVSGGYSGSSALGAAELYDPASGTWSAASSLSLPRHSHTETPLPNGTVLFSGGSASGTTPLVAELYTP